MTISLPMRQILNDTAIGGATTIDSGVKYAVVYLMTAINEIARRLSIYRFDD
ncbi:hypothetical protein [Pseudanabaena sp. 'Roaring Creek']|uniref:hypothetical protein n=1 Tax=Pseudanabaena sp. 'Roaring Creek' TaxID=1681830 RepID=UPI000B284359|nr:hypothetical protein [Pseudanabaena sp. 'Roaring Creek']